MSIFNDLKRITINEFWDKMNDGSNILLDYECDRFNNLDENHCSFYMNDDIIFFTETDKDEYSIYGFSFKDMNYDEFFKECIEDEKCTDINISTINFLPSGINNHLGGLAFKKVGMEYIDDEIVSLESKDTDAILTFCKELSKGSFFEKDEAKTFKYIVKQKLFTIFGCFDKGVLVGMVFYRMIDEKKLGVVSELAVLRDYQRRGIGKRLVRKVLSIYPKYNYIYTCHRDNEKSIALTTACGFDFCGVKNFNIK